MYYLPLSKVEGLNTPSVVELKNVNWVFKDIWKREWISWFGSVSQFPAALGVVYTYKIIILKTKSQTHKLNVGYLISLAVEIYSFAWSLIQTHAHTNMGSQTFDASQTNIFQPREPNSHHFTFHE